MSKRVLILGGTSDIGIAIAKKFAEEKFDIILAGRNHEYMERVQRDISIRSGVEVQCISFDATAFSSHSDFFRSLKFCPDVCVCVFGYLGDQQTAQHNWNEAERIIDINYKGAVSILSVVANEFENAKKGTIIGISSVAGDRGRQSNYIYGSAKAGFTAFLSGLRNRLHSKNVHVITVKPGFVNTQMTEGLNLPPRLTAQPREVATATWKAYEGNKNIVYVRSLWRYIMLVIRFIPEFIFKKLQL